ncbi:hypothetical protein DLR65_12650 [Vibrio tarriae]|uniref:hypothetical protein n=1 Tax=Vibrio TaxID=662 RepID=UPI0006D7B4DF|nr:MULTISPECIES: hypothetical protein [Vibrio]KQA22869.1 hypothetical protein AAY53_17970 [Vibrio metoecus]RBM48141.1 hypothetical protein DLR65_12650 [Vibrio tarriae]
MSKTKKRTSRNPSKKVFRQAPAVNQPSRLKKLWAFLIGSGLLLVSFQVSFNYINESVAISFTRPLNSGYEFKATNSSPIDYTVEKLRIYPDFKQEVIFTITKDILVELPIDGAGVSMPGGNETYIPAYEFKELDGVEIESNSSEVFRIPPLSARDYYKPAAMIVFIEYEVMPTSSFINAFHRKLASLGWINPVTKNKYLVSGDYWTRISLNSETSALEAACRDTEWFSKSSKCKI